jgi:hypothetical protein
MLWLIPIGIGVGTVAVLISRARASGTAPGQGTSKGSQSTNKKRLWAQLQAIPQLDDDQRKFFIYVAQGESRYNPMAFNDSPGEARAAGEAYDKHANEFSACGYTRAELARGSGGRFGRLLPYFVRDVAGVLPCIEPSAINDGYTDILSAIRLARIHQDNPQWDGTVGSLRAGWATPGDLHPTENRLAKMRATATDAGLGPEFISRRLKPITRDLPGVLAALLTFKNKAVA